MGGGGDGNIKKSEKIILPTLCLDYIEAFLLFYFDRRVGGVGDF